MDAAVKFYWTEAEKAINAGSYQQMSRLMKVAIALEDDYPVALTNEEELGKDIPDEKAIAAKKYVIYRKQTHDGKKV